MSSINIPERELKNLYENRQLTAQEIADMYRCCKATVLNRLRLYAIERLPSGRRTAVISKAELKKLYLKQKLSSRKIGKIYGYWSTTIDSKIKEYGFPTRSRAEAHIIYPRKSFDGSDTDKAYLIGFATGDLRTRKMYQNSETITIDCGSTKKAQLDLISQLFKPYGRVWVSKINKRGVRQIQCQVDMSFDFLLSKRSLIEPWILRDRNNFFAFLAGFTDAEGCISITSEKAYYSLGNYNKDLLLQIRKYLLEMGVMCSKLGESKIKGRVCFEKYRHNQNYWQLHINRKSSLLSFFDFLEPYMKHSDKEKAMRDARANIFWRNKIFARKEYRIKS